MTGKLITESVNPGTVGIDKKSVQEILKIMNENDRLVPLAVEKTIPQITEAVEIIVKALKTGGRLFYIGAGTSGRLGIVDAAECTPTFGVPDEMVQGIIAGGRGTVFKAREGAEDNEKQGAIDLRRRGFKAGDVVVGLSTSGRTPYVCGALDMARKLGTSTISIICNPEGRVRDFSDIVICPIVGPEVITGSTRLKAGTSEKLVLNMISTTVMIKLGRVDGNMMSHMQISCGKLKERAINTIMLKGKLDRPEAEKLLNKHSFQIDVALNELVKFKKENHFSSLMDGVRRIVFFGDSLTDSSLYPDYVVNTLKQAYPENDFELVNAGVSGDTAADLLLRVNKEVIKQGPELVILGIGTNDCLQSCSIEHFEEDMSEIVEQIRDCGSKVLLIKPSPIRCGDYPTRFIAYLQAIDSVASHMKIPLADAYSEFERGINDGQTLISEDGVHHSLAGFKTMARVVLEALGVHDVEMNIELNPDPGTLLDWESSYPVPWTPEEPLPSLSHAKNWKPYDLNSLLHNTIASVFACRGAWMPFALNSPKKPSLAFGRSFFNADGEGLMELQLGGSDPMVVWLNGTEIWRSTRRHGLHPKAHCMDVAVRDGKNEIVVLSDSLAFIAVIPIGKLSRTDGYNIRRHALKMPPHQQAEMDLRNHVNAEFLEKIILPPTGGKLTGSFIYAHPGGYRGRSTINYGIPEWRSLFRELKELGMDTAIMGVAAWHDYNECFYPSDMFKNLRTLNIIEPMLAAAADEQMRIYLGGLYQSESALGCDTGDLKKSNECAERELACYRELVLRYRGAFHGYYLASESGFWSWGNQEFLSRCYHSFLKKVTNGVKDITPELPIIGSPYTVRCPGREAEALDILSKLHSECPFTALAPQDSIGVTLNELDFLERGLGIWKIVCENIGAEFWVNCETFNCTDFGGPFSNIVPADFKRLAIQLDTAQNLGAKKIITWEAIHFMNPSGSRAAKKLRSEYLNNRN